MRKIITRSGMASALLVGLVSNVAVAEGYRGTLRVYTLPPAKQIGFVYPNGAIESTIDVSGTPSTMMIPEGGRAAVDDIGFSLKNGAIVWEGVPETRFAVDGGIVEVIGPEPLPPGVSLLTSGSAIGAYGQSLPFISSSPKHLDYLVPVDGSSHTTPIFSLVRHFESIGYDVRLRVKPSVDGANPTFLDVAFTTLSRREALPGWPDAPAVGKPIVDHVRALIATESAFGETRAVCWARKSFPVIVALFGVEPARSEPLISTSSRVQYAASSIVTRYTGDIAINESEGVPIPGFSGHAVWRFAEEDRESLPMGRGATGTGRLAFSAASGGSFAPEGVDEEVVSAPRITLNDASGESRFKVVLANSAGAARSGGGFSNSGAASRNATPPQGPLVVTGLRDDPDASHAFRYVMEAPPLPKGIIADIHATAGMERPSAGAASASVRVESGVMLGYSVGESNEGRVPVYLAFFYRPDDSPGETVVFSTGFEATIGNHVPIAVRLISGDYLLVTTTIDEIRLSGARKFTPN